MDIFRLIDAAPDWMDQTWVQRMDECASVLYLHGYINQSARTKITEKIEKQFKTAIAEGRIKERAK